MKNIVIGINETSKQLFLIEANAHKIEGYLAKQYLDQVIRLYFVGTDKLWDFLDEWSVMNQVDLTEEFPLVIIDGKKGFHECLSEIQHLLNKIAKGSEDQETEAKL